MREVVEEYGKVVLDPLAPLDWPFGNPTWVQVSCAAPVLLATVCGAVLQCVSRGCARSCTSLVAQLRLCVSRARVAGAAPCCKRVRATAVLKERHFLLQAHLKSAKAGDDEEEILKKTLQRTGEKSEALKAYLRVLFKEERTEVRIPKPQLHSAHRVLQACSPIFVRACVDMALIWSLDQLKKLCFQVRQPLSLYMAAGEDSGVQFCWSMLISAVSCAGDDGGTVSNGQRLARPWQQYQLYPLCRCKSQVDGELLGQFTMSMRLAHLRALRCPCKRCRCISLGPCTHQPDDKSCRWGRSRRLAHGVAGQASKLQLQSTNPADK